MKKIYIICMLVCCLLVGCSQLSPREDNTQNQTNETQITDISTERTLSQTEIHFIATGNSDCILIKSDKVALIDAGDNDDEERIVTYLKQQNINKIDYLISTHPDADHCGGLDAVVNTMEIGQTFVCNGTSTTKSYRDFINELSQKKLTPAVPLENKKFNLGGQTYIQFYNTKSTSKDMNDLSLVTLLVSGNKKALFTGDCSTNKEKELMKILPDIDVLKVGHHGSKSSTCLEFLKTVKPEYAVICTGKNQYGHPAQQVLSSLNECDIQTYRTDECGNIIFMFQNNQITIKNRKQLDINKTQHSTTSQIHYIGNTNTHKFHKQTCSSVKKMSEKHRVVYTEKSEFLNRGYEPCQSCHP